MRHLYLISGAFRTNYTGCDMAKKDTIGIGVEADCHK
jgi:hypothetical protein